MKFYKVSISLLLILFSSISQLRAQTPRTFSYQGQVTNSDGSTPENGPYSITFNLYNQPNGGSVLWSEGHNVSLLNGIFNAILGNNTPLNLQFDRPYWLGIAINGQTEMAPRIELTASPYSLHALSVADSSITLDKLVPNVVSSINGVNNNGGNIELVGGSNINITPNDNDNTIIINTESDTGSFLALAGGTMTGPIDSEGDQPITMGKSNFGSGNQNSGDLAIVAGSDNMARGNYSVVAGGSKNSANGDNSVISGGTGNAANGKDATVSGGFNNSANGDYSMAAGKEAKAEHTGTFVWSDTQGQFTSTAENQFLVRADGGVGIGTDSPQAPLHVDGEIRADGIELNASAQRYLSFPGISFQPSSSSSSYVVAGGGWLQGAAPGQALIFSLPLQLPHGARVTGFEVQVIDNAATEDMTVSFNYGTKSGSVGNAGQIVTTGNSTEVRTFLRSLPATINNTLNTYYLNARWTTPANINNMRLVRVQVDYEVDSLLP